MKNIIAHVESPENFTVFIDGKTHTVSKSQVNCDSLRKAIDNSDINKIMCLVSPQSAIEHCAKDSGVEITIKNGRIFYKSEELHGVLADKIIDLQSGGYNIKYLIKFLENLMSNPSFRVINELYSFLQFKNIPITPNGTFLAYKAVRNDWMDKHSGKFKHTIGAEMKIDRRMVDDNWEKDCSNGFHAGNLEYVTGFASNYGKEGGDRIIIVEINPADVVCCPNGESSKLRTCKYLVVAEFTGPLSKPVYNSDATEHEIEDDGVCMGDEDEEDGEDLEEGLDDSNCYLSNGGIQASKKHTKAVNYLKTLNLKRGKPGVKVGSIAKKLHKKVNHEFIISAASELGLDTKEVGKWKKDWIIRAK